MDLSSCSNTSEGSYLSTSHGYNLRKRSIESYSIGIKHIKLDSSARTRPVVYKRRKKADDTISAKFQKYFEAELVATSSAQKFKHDNFKVPKSNVHINQLPGCVMASIFKFLVPLDRIKVERVCRRWNYIVRNFSWGNMNSLTIESIAPQFTSSFTSKTFLFGERRIKAMTSRIGAIINRSAKYLVDVNFSHLTFLGYKVCNFLMHTPNVVHLNLSGILLTNTSLSTIGRSLPLLKNRTQVERGLSHFLNYCKSLEMLDVSDNEHFAGESCFNDLSETLLHLHISNNYRIGNKAISGIYKNCPKLKSLVMDRIDLVSPRELNLLFDNLPELEILQYGDCFNNSLSTAEMVSIGNLRNLRQLTLYDNAIVSESVLKAISYNCIHLEKLDLSSSNRRISDQGLRHLANLRKLSVLNFSGMRLLSNQTLKDIASNCQLNELLLHRCYKISDDSIIYVLKKCKQLSMLDVSYCINVTDLSLRQILENLDSQHGKMVPTEKMEKEKFCLWTKRSGITFPFPPYFKNPWLKMMNEMDYEFVLMGHLLHHVNNLGPFPMLFDL